MFSELCLLTQSVWFVFTIRLKYTWLTLALFSNRLPKCLQFNRPYLYSLVSKFSTFSKISSSLFYSRVPSFHLFQLYLNLLPKLDNKTYISVHRVNYIVFKFITDIVCLSHLDSCFIVSLIFSPVHCLVQKVVIFMLFFLMIGQETPIGSISMKRFWFLTFVFASALVLTFWVVSLLLFFTNHS